MQQIVIQPLSGTRASQGWTWGGCSDLGTVRSENQDRMGVVAFPGGQALLVCDGMGGHADGGVAAELALRTLTQYLAAIRPELAAEDVLREAFAATNAIIHAQGRAANGSERPMGSTAVVCVTREAAALVGHVGDSRAYLHREGQLQQLTRDHTRVQRMVDAGMLTPEQARHHPDGGILTRSLGVIPEVEAELAAWLPLRAGDEILLCSDGLSSYVEDAHIAAALDQDGTPQQLAEALVALALQCGSDDNVTVQLIRYRQRRRSLRHWLRQGVRRLRAGLFKPLRTGSDPS
ncbi:MAG: serine/threonine-protein phosphatase [Pseudomonadota bacterium]|nr:serine/threonine-protein phosphatase [Pseudomonadota bacterium]